MDRYREGHLLTAEPGRVDVDRVHASLSHESYWTKGGQRAVTEQSIAGSRPYSVYAQEQLRPTRVAGLGVDPAPMPTRDQA